MPKSNEDREDRFEEEIGERLEEAEMTPAQLAEHLYNQWKDVPEGELDAEMEELQVRYGRVDPVYEQVFQRILKERAGRRQNAR